MRTKQEVILANPADEVQQRFYFFIIGHIHGDKEIIKVALLGALKIILFLKLSAIPLELLDKLLIG